MTWTTQHIKAMFGKETYVKGLEYYQEDRVCSPVKLNNTLYARVQGSAPNPYEVTVAIGEQGGGNECSCPMRSACKHCVALLLKWVNEPDAFSNGDEFLLSIQGKEKSELLALVQKIILEHPALVDELVTPEIPSNTPSPEMIEAFTRRIRKIIRGDLDYYAIHGAVNQLAPLKKRADAVAGEGNWRLAVEMYLALIKGGVAAFDEGADDSDGELGDLLCECVEACTDAIHEIDDRVIIDQILDKVLPIAAEEDYGLETQDLLFDLVTPENMPRVERYFLAQLKRMANNNDDSTINYHKRTILDLLGQLYDFVEQPGERLRLAHEYLNTREDYASLARALVDNRQLEQALQAVVDGFKVPKDASYPVLGGLYFEVAKKLLRKAPSLINRQVAINAALEVLEFRFDETFYQTITTVFKSLGLFKEAREEILHLLSNQHSAEQLLLFEGDIPRAITLVTNNEKIGLDAIIEVAQGALDLQCKEDAKNLMMLAIERGDFHTGFARPTLDPLLSNLVALTDDAALETAIQRLPLPQDLDFLLQLLSHILKKSPPCVAKLAKKNIKWIPPDMIRKIAGKLDRISAPDTAALCWAKLSADFLRSRSNYNEVPQLLQIARDVAIKQGEKAKWEKRLQQFVNEHHGKKQLLDILRGAFPQSRI